MNYQAFVKREKVLAVAPAGHGKTYSIAECLKYVNGKQLILTHTHAGIASIKDKIKNLNIPANSYNVETISSFAQKYVTAFYNGDDTPDQEDDLYHSFIINKAVDIIKISPVRDVLKASYSGVFIDEYQDCTKLQHSLILSLSELMPTRILGDHMQGIFDFNDDLNNFPSDLIENNFEQFPDLSVPYRWQNAGKNALGEALKEIREKLEKGEPIDLVEYTKNKNIFFCKTNSKDIYNSESKCRKWLDRLIYNPNKTQDFNSLLLIVPTYKEVIEGKEVLRGKIGERKKIKQIYLPLVLIEAIDDNDFYSMAKKFDSLIDDISNTKKPYKKIAGLLTKLFKKTDLNIWIAKPNSVKEDSYFKNKKTEPDKIKVSKLQKVFDNFIHTPSAENLHRIIKEVSERFDFKCARQSLLSSIIKSLEESKFNRISIYEAMKSHRNLIRRIGRRIDGKCIGTTLLTKGLEFDTVVILDADKFDCPKHLYVALTRCCKNLVIFSGNDKLQPCKVFN